MVTKVKATNPMGARLKALRTQHGMTQTILADKLDCSIGTISRIETTDTLDGVSTAMVRDICNLFGCSMDWLVNGDGPDPSVEGSPIDGVLGDQTFGDLSRLRVFNFTDCKSLRHIMITSEEHWLKYRVGEVIVIDTAVQPDSGDEVVAMVNGEAKLMRMLQPTGDFQLVELLDGQRQIFDPATAAWFGTVSGTLNNKRVRSVAR